VLPWAMEMSAFAAGLLTRGPALWSAATIDLSPASSGEPWMHPSSASARAMRIPCIASASGVDDSGGLAAVVVAGGVQPSTIENV
jgi:hypothetical protein